MIVLLTMLIHMCLHYKRGDQCVHEKETKPCMTKLVPLIETNSDNIEVSDY